MSDWRGDRIGSTLRGENPTVLMRLPGGFAVMGDPQWLPGYCVLLSDDPEADRLSALARPGSDRAGDRRRANIPAVPEPLELAQPALAFVP